MPTWLPPLATALIEGLPGPVLLLGVLLIGLAAVVAAVLLVVPLLTMLGVTLIGSSREPANRGSRLLLAYRGVAPPEPAPPPPPPRRWWQRSPSRPS